MNNVYGYCPICGGAGCERERRPFGNDICVNGDEYPSATALPSKDYEVVTVDGFDSTAGQIYIKYNGKLPKISVGDKMIVKIVKL
jgi:hypothetical protein